MEEAQELAARAREVLARLLPLSPPTDGLAGMSVGAVAEVGTEVEGQEEEVGRKREEVEKWDDLSLFDHLQPVFDGRFTGRRLLGYIAEREQ